MRPCFFIQISFLTLMAVLAFATSSTAQIPSGPFDNIGPPVTFPGTLGDSESKINLNFQAVSYGGVLSDVALKTLVHKEGGDYTFYNSPDPFVIHTDLLNINGHLWEMRLTRQTPTGEEEITIDPSDAAGFEAFHTVGYENEPAMLFRWNGVQVDSNNTLTVELVVSLGATDSVSRWYGRAEWQTKGGVGQGARIEEFDFPITCFKPPVAPRPGEDSYEALKRARLLIPSSLILQEAQVVTQNMSAEFFFRVYGNKAFTDRTYKHPNPSEEPIDATSQHLQFAVFYNGDEQDTNGFRRMLYVGTEDETGHFKRFRYQGLGEKSAAGEWTLRFGWRATHFPPYADVLVAGGPIATDWHNTFDSPYPAVLGALRALDDAFWYDAAAYYRSFVEAKGLGGPLFHENPNIGSYKGPSILSLFASTTAEFGIETYRRYLDLMLTFMKVIENDHVSPTDAAFMHWQHYLNYQLPIPDGRNPIYPVCEESDGGDVDSGVYDIIKEARLNHGIRTSLYSIPKRVLRSSNWWNGDFFHPSSEAFRSDGSPLGESPNGYEYAILDYGGSESWTVYPQFMYREFAKTLGAVGTYLDTTSGVGATRSYDPPDWTPTHIAHGGDYWTQGKIKLIDNIRKELQINSPFVTPPDTDKNALVFSEGAEEYLAGHLDATGVGYYWPPYYLLLAEAAIPEVINGTSVTGLPPETTTWSPPLWNSVYHEWAPTTDQVIPFTNVGLATNEEYNPGGVRGMGADELRNLFCYFYSVFYCQGSKPASFTYLKQFDSPLVKLDDNGNLCVDEEKDPTGVGLEIASMIRTLYASLQADYAGQYILSGRLLRPLQVDYSIESEVDRMENPAKACENSYPENLVATYPTQLVHKHPGQDLFKIAHQSFKVPSVLHSMWLSRSTGNRGLVLVNWTASKASWSGVFNPELFELQGDQPYSISRLVLGGQSENLGQFTGPIEIHANPGVTSGSDLYLEKIPPQSVVIIQFYPTWSDLGHGLADNNGLTPVLNGTGTGQPGTQVTLSLSNAKPNTTAWLIYGIVRDDAPFHGGTRVPSIDYIVPGVVNGSGELVLNINVPLLSSGSSIYLQCWITDPSGPVGFTASNALEARVP